MTASRFLSRLLYAWLGAAWMVSGCGYHVAGHSATLPKSIHVIAVPALERVGRERGPRAGALAPTLSLFRAHDLVMGRAVAFDVSPTKL